MSGNIALTQKTGLSLLDNYGRCCKSREVQDDDGSAIVANNMTKIDVLCCYLRLYRNPIINTVEHIDIHSAALVNLLDGELSQKASMGTAIHWSRGATPVPSRGKTGIKSE